MWLIKDNMKSFFNNTEELVKNERVLMKTHINIYTKEKLGVYVKIAEVLFYIGLLILVVIIISLNILSLNPLPWYYVLIMDRVVLLISVLLTIYVWIKQLIFIYGYDLKSDSWFNVKLIRSLLVSEDFIIRITVTVIWGFLM